VMLVYFELIVYCGYNIEGEYHICKLGAM